MDAANQLNVQQPPSEEAVDSPIPPAHPNNPAVPLEGAQLPPNPPPGPEALAPENIVAPNDPAPQVVAPVALPPALGASPLLRSLFGRPSDD